MKTYRPVYTFFHKYLMNGFSFSILFTSRVTKITSCIIIMIMIIIIIITRE